MKSLVLLLVSLLVTFVVLEALTPDKYSRNDIYRVESYKKRFGSRLDWINKEFRDRTAVDTGIIKGVADCAESSPRVLVSGDSFVYGKGSSINVTWDAQLTYLVKTIGSGTCVLAIGKDGWTTMDQLSFLKANWDLLRPDMILWGYVTNDPDFGDIPRKYWFDHGPSSCQKVYPFRIFNLVKQKVCFILQQQHEAIGYEQWVSLVHEPGNLERYKSVLIDLKSYLDARQVPFHFLLTSKTWEYDGAQQHQKIGQLMTDVGIPYTDVLPMVTRFFSPFPESFRWAHPGDGHPSALVNTFFAWHGYDQLCRYGFVQYKCDEFRKRIIEIND